MTGPLVRSRGTRQRTPADDPVAGAQELPPGLGGDLRAGDDALAWPHGLVAESAEIRARRVMEVEVLAAPGQARTLRHEGDRPKQIRGEVVQDAVITTDVQRGAPIAAGRRLVLLDRYQDLPAVRGAAGDGPLVVLRHVARSRQRACQFAYNGLGSGVSPDITHAFLIASALAFGAHGARRHEAS